jgi:hypothetical protein
MKRINIVLASIRKNPWLSLLAVLYMAAMIAYAGPKSRKLNETSDYYWVFWRSGKDFAEKHELYYRETTRPFNYMPFAAFVFQPLHLLPLQISALIYFLINALLLPPVALYLLYKILRLMGVGKRKSEISLILVTLFTLQYFWNNLTMFNVNYILFVIILLGFYFLIQKKPHLAGILFTIITFIKIMPVLLAAYVFLFHPSRRVVLTMVLTAVICLSIPAPFRGMERWVDDHVDHYENVISPYMLKGRIVATKTNHSLKAGIVKAFHSESRGNSAVYPEQYPVTIRFISILQLILLAVLVINGIILKRRKIYFSLAYLASILLFMNLISGLTWSAHMVTLMFCLLPVVLMDTGKLPIRGKIFYYISLALFLFLCIEGSDTTGEKIYQAIRDYDVYTFLLLGLFLFCSWVVWSRQSFKFYQEDIKI